VGRESLVYNLQDRRGDRTDRTAGGGTVTGCFAAPGAWRSLSNPSFVVTRFSNSTDSEIWERALDSDSSARSRAPTER